MAEVLRIGAFFDGTGNNMWNDLAIEDASQTNVAKLYQLYKDQNYKFLYEEGVGTEEFEDGTTFSNEIIEGIQNGSIIKNDQYDKLSMGFGTTAKDHVDSMLGKIETLIKLHPDEEIVLDVYGFSRGAAEARDFINEVNKIYTNVGGGSIVGFVGLFDTVASIGLATNYDFNLNLNLDHDSAQTIFQITAQNEMRANFPLESLKKEGGNISEESLPGVHSDIGGGYGALDLEQRLVVSGTDELEMFNFESEAQDRIAERQLELYQIQLDNPSIKYELMHEIYTESDPAGSVLYRLSSAIVEVREIEYGLSKEALNLMYEKITSSGIELPKLNSLGSVIFPGDGETYNLWEPPEKPYDAEEYIHISSSNDLYGRTLLDWIAHREEWNWDGVRDTHYNESEKAMVELLNLSKEDKIILYDRRSEDYSILGVEQTDLSLLDEYTEFYIEDRAQYLDQFLRLSADPAYNDTYSGEIPPGENVFSHFLDKTTGKRVYDSTLSGVVVFGSDEPESVTGDKYSNHLYGGDGNDLLDGKGGSDRLEGGLGVDSYKVGDGDTIYDIDGKGKVIFDKQLLGQGILQEDGTYKSEDGKIVYSLTGTTLTVSFEGKTLIIENFQQSGDLGITLIGKPAIPPEPTVDILGDRATWDSDTATPGVQIAYDALGNEITTATVDPDKQDLLYDSLNNDHIIAGGGDDEIQAFRGGHDHIEAGAGLDLVVATDGNDVIEGGSETDILVGGAGNDYIYANSKSDYDTIFLSTEETPTGPDRDWLTGGDGDDHLIGSNGDEAFSGGGGSDTILAGAGDDNIFGDDDWAADSFEWTFTDNPTQNGNTRLFSPVLSAFNPGPAGEDVIFAGAGADYVWAGAESDTVFGESGNDTIYGEEGSDFVFGGEGNDKLRGDNGNADDSTSGNDYLDGGAGDDVLNGGAGDDDLIGGDGNDQLHGDGGAESPENHGNDTLDGGAGNDTLVGSGGHDTLYGGGDNDTLDGDDGEIDGAYHGNDWLYGGSGIDRLTGNGGDDHLFGGEDNDYLYGDDNGLDESYHGNDYLYGNDGDDSIYAQGGDDILFGGMGDDGLFGGEGSDQLFGNDGNDYLDGEEDDDAYYFSSGDGIDVVSDQSGSNEIVFENTSSSSVLARMVIDTRNENYLRLEYGVGDTVFVKNGWNGSINKFRFTDKTLTISELANTKIDSRIDLSMSNTGTAYGSQYDDKMAGTIGDDKIFGQDGDDLLAGGQGDDQLVGGSGHDTYYIGLGSGYDEIVEMLGQDGTLVVQDGVVLDDLVYRRLGNDLEIGIAYRKDGVLLKDFFLNEQNWTVQDEYGESIQIDLNSVPNHGLVELPSSVNLAMAEFQNRIDQYIKDRVRGYELQSDGIYLREYTKYGRFIRDELDLRLIQVGIGDVSDQYRQVDGDKYFYSFGSGALLHPTWYRVENQSEYRRLIDNGSITYQEDQVQWTSEGAEYISVESVESILTELNTTTDMYQLGGGVGGYGVRVGEEYSLLPVFGSTGGVSPFSGYQDSKLLGYWAYRNQDTSPFIVEETVTHDFYHYRSWLNEHHIQGTDEADTVSVYTGKSFTPGLSIVNTGLGNDTVNLGVKIEGPHLATSYRENYQYIDTVGSFINGGMGDDSIVGTASEDVLVGGAGNDYLAGGMGNDEYYLFEEDGWDIVFDDGIQYLGYNSKDTLYMPASVSLEDLSISTDQIVVNGLYQLNGWRSRSDSIHTALRLDWGTGGVSVVLPHTDQNAGTGLDYIQFSNEERFTVTDFLQKTGENVSYNPHLGNNDFQGIGSLYGGAGDDVLRRVYSSEPRPYDNYHNVIGGSGSDYLIGSLRDEYLFGGEVVFNNTDMEYVAIGSLWDEGNIFEAGAGDDTIWTTSGSDRIEYRLGDGKDTVTDLLHHFRTLEAIEDGKVLGSTQLYELLIQSESERGLEGNRWDSLFSSSDVLSFGDGISPGDISVVRGKVADDSRGGFEDSDPSESYELIFQHTNGVDHIAFRNWFRSEFNQLNRVEFSDGSYWTIDDINTMLEGGTANQAPIVQNPNLDQSATEDALFTYQVPSDTFFDADATESLIYSAILSNGDSIPEWLSFDPTTKTFTGTPSNSDVGTLEVKVTATDAFGESVSDVFSLMIENTNDAPVVYEPIVDQTAVEDEIFSYKIPAGTFADVDSNDSLSISASLVDDSPLPSWVTFDSDTEIFTVAPGNDQVGDHEFKVTATDTTGESISESFTITVQNTNDKPVLSGAIADQLAQHNTYFEFSSFGGVFSDPDVDDILTLSAEQVDGSPLPGWLTFDPTVGAFFGIPSDGDLGDIDIKVTATDVAGESVSETFQLQISPSPVNPGLILTGADGFDVLIGGGLDDVIHASSGNDFLYGGSGNDLFMFDGNNTGFNTIVGGTGFDKVIGGYGDDVIGVLAWMDTMSVEVVDGGHGYNVIQGNQWGRILDFSGTELRNIHEIRGGNAGWGDRIIGSNGDDVLVGLQGNDMVSGGLGNDVYKFSYFDGRDVIRNNDSSEISTDSLEFTNIAYDQLWFSQSKDDLLINVIGSNDQIRFENWYLSESEKIDQISAGGHTLYQDQLAQLVNAMAVFDVPDGSDAIVPESVRNELAPVLAANWQ